MRYLITLILCLLAGNVQAFPPGFLATATHSYVASGGITFVDTAHGDAAALATSVSTSDNLTVNANDLIVCFIQGGVSFPSEVSCGSNTLTNANLEWYGDSYIGRVYYLEGAAANTGTCTATYVANSDYRGITCASYSGIATSSALDDADYITSSSTRTSSSSSITPTTNITTTNANDLIVVIGSAWDSTDTYTGSNGYTSRLSGAINFIFDKVVTSTGTHPNGTVGTGSVSDTYFGYTLSFKKAP
jgi:hypothetical protein